jgi:DNA-binding beta-propeller fold protein YncE
MRQPSSGRHPLTRRRLAATLTVTGCAAACVLTVTAVAATTSARPVQTPRMGAGHTALQRAVTQAPGRAAGADGLITLDGAPGYPVANPETGTVYVPIQCGHTDCVPRAPEHVDVVNAAKCNATARTDCRVAATIRVGTGPIAAVVDERTDTIYVTNGNDNTVSVINGARCQAGDTRGCATAVVATVKVGKFPVAETFNPATRTVYVANLTGSISVLNAATCNARSTRGCGKPVRTVPDRAGPDYLDVDVATDTVYAANGGPSGEGGDTVSVIDGAACNGHTGHGCGRIRASVKVGLNPSTVTVDQATDTVYVANHDGAIGGLTSASGAAGSVSVINGARCNAKITSGCGLVPATVPTGTNTSFVAVDDALHTVFAVNEFDDTMSAVDTRTCDGTVTSGCANRPPNQQAEPDYGPGYAQFPTVFAVIGKLHTAYVTDGGGPSRLSVLNFGRCNAVTRSGCRGEAPTVPNHDTVVAEDPATRTIYASNASRPRIDVINAAACHPGQPSGCAAVAAIPMPDPQANVGGIDHATHTLYAADPAKGKVAVINTADCNAGHISGCSAAPPLITVGPNPGPPGVNPVTRTVYVPEGKASNKVAVINATACNATNTSGCGQKPARVSVAKGTFSLAVSPATNTVYASATGLFTQGGFHGQTIAVINGATCNGANHSGCRHLAATIRAGRAPWGMTVNDRTHTLYAAINTSGGFPASVAVINTATCNGTHTVGCHGPFPHMPTGATPQQTALDTSTGILYVTDGTSAEVTALNTAHCNATITTGCRMPGRRLPIGSSPAAVAVDQQSNTVYVTNTYQAGAVTVFAGQP